MHAHVNMCVRVCVCMNVGGSYLQQEKSQKDLPEEFS